MKKNNLTKGLFAALLLASPLVGADEKYPAADFQPEVVFQDSEYIAKNGQSSAAHVSNNSSSANVSESSAADSKYPAANFQPQVVYSDPNYKHSDSSVAVKSVEQENIASESKTESSVSGKKEQSSPNSLFALIGLAAVGAFLFRKQLAGAQKAAEISSAAAPARTAGLTGVARYLNKKSGTGVSRYLEKQVKSAAAATGVAKYVAKQASSAKATATQAATGVEKYMRNRG